MLTIGIPTVNRWDLLRPTLAYYMAIYNSSFEILIVDNGNQGIDQWVKENSYPSGPRVKVHIPSENLGVSKSWNYICQNAKHPNFLLLNDDICIGASQKTLEYMVTECLNFNTFLKGTLNWSAIMFDLGLYNIVGPFDETFFPAYFEDNDFSYRMKLRGIAETESINLKPIRSINSGSIQKNPELNTGFQKNRTYYINKWGGVPGSETFTKPFNL